MSIPLDSSIDIDAFIKTRFHFLITEYGFEITEERTTYGPDSAWIVYSSDKVSLHAYSLPARCDYSIFFSLIGDNEPAFGVSELIQIMQIKIPVTPVSEFKPVPSVVSARSQLDWCAQLLEDSDGRYSKATPIFINDLATIVTVAAKIICVK